MLSGKCAADSWKALRDTMGPMHRRLFAVFAATIILLMVVPPVCNSFDKWDKGPELPLAGRDTETTLSIVALEVGMGLAVAWGSIFLLNWLAAVHSRLTTETASLLIPCGIRATDYLLLLFSPPWQSLPIRI
jgi:hypothetical protein